MKGGVVKGVVKGVANCIYQIKDPLGADKNRYFKPVSINEQNQLVGHYSTTKDFTNPKQWPVTIENFNEKYIKTMDGCSYVPPLSDVNIVPSDTTFPQHSGHVYKEIKINDNLNIYLPL